MDWLNKITPDGFSFFGLEIELWRIDDSLMAPKFNVVSHPNDWTKTVSRVSRDELTPTQQLYLEYWTGLRDLLVERSSAIKPTEPRAKYWMSFDIGRSKFRLAASASVREKWICVSLTLRGPDAKPHFYLLKGDKVDIEREIGDELEWDEKHGRKRDHINLSSQGGNLISKTDQTGIDSTNGYVTSSKSFTRSSRHGLRGLMPAIISLKRTRPPNSPKKHWL